MGLLPFGFATAPGAAAAQPPALFLACRGSTGEFTITTPDGGFIEHTTGFSDPSAAPALLRIDPAGGSVAVAGGTLPHTAGGLGRARVSGTGIEFEWGDVAFRVDPGGSSRAGSWIGRSRSVMQDGPKAGNTVTAVFSGPCAPATEADFSAAPPVARSGREP